MLLGALALGTLNLGGDLRQEDAFTDRPDSVSAMRTLAEEYPERSAQPITVIAPAGDADEVVERVRGTEGVAEAAAGRADGTWAEITVFATAPPESAGRPAPSRPCATPSTAPAPMSAGPARSISTSPAARRGTARSSCRWCWPPCS